MTTHIEREHQSSESNVLENVNNNNKILLPENRNNVNNPNVSTLEKHAYLVIGPRNVSKPYYLFEMLEKLGNQRPIHIITRSPNQNPNYETSNENKPTKKYK